MCPSTTETPSSGGGVPAKPSETSLSHSLAIPSQALAALVPDTALSRSIFGHVVAALPLAIVHHSLRVFLFARWLAQRENSPWADSDLLFAASIGHDLGASHLHGASSERFEVEGADATVDLLRSHQVCEPDLHQVWVAIALHTSPHLAERITPLARLVRLGVLIDFRTTSRESWGAVKFGNDVEAKLPRLDIEKVLGDAVVHQAILNPLKAPPVSWPHTLYRSHLEDPGWTGVNRGF